MDVFQIMKWEGFEKIADWRIFLNAVDNAKAKLQNHELGHFGLFR